MERYQRWLRNLPVLAGIVLILLIVFAIYLLQDTFKKPSHPKKQVQQITMIQPPPPPPPPPPEQKAPEPEPEPQKLPEPEAEPEQKPEEAEEPPGEELGVDADGTAGSDGFGLLGRKSGRGLLGGNGGNAIRWYGGQIKKGLEEALQNLLDESVRNASYTLYLKVWVNDDGSVNRAELAQGSGNPAVDGGIRTALSKLSFSLPKPPPETMPQPVKIHLTSKI